MLLPWYKIITHGVSGGTRVYNQGNRVIAEYCFTLLDALLA